MKKLILLAVAFIALSCLQNGINNHVMENNEKQTFKVDKTDEEWKQELTPEQYYVMREAGTERPFTGEFNMHFEKGTYTCGSCGTPLFDSDSKFDARCGWPSFDCEKETGKILERVDTSHGMVRTEVLCGNCGAHLGHVFNDGPTETGIRYCINSLSLGFEEEDTDN